VASHSEVLKERKNEVDDIPPEASGKIKLLVGKAKGKHTVISG
jgi:hypothetical protein